MSLGLGIFLSALTLGIIFLFNATKDRWRWKRIMLWSLGVSVLLPSMAAAVIYAAAYVRDWPIAQTELWNIKIGTPKEDVLFLKGEPAKRSGTKWLYQAQNDYADAIEYAVSFDENRVRYVAVLTPDSGVSINGIGFGDSYQRVSARLGDAGHISKSNDGLSRILSFPKYNMAVGFGRGQVEFLAIYDGKRPLTFESQSEEKR